MSKRAFISHPHSELTAIVVNTLIYEDYLHSISIILPKSTRDIHIFCTNCNYQIDLSIISAYRDLIDDPETLTPDFESDIPYLQAATIQLATRFDDIFNDAILVKRKQFLSIVGNDERIQPCDQGQWQLWRVQHGPEYHEEDDTYTRLQPGWHV